MELGSVDAVGGFIGLGAFILAIVALGVVNRKTQNQLFKTLLSIAIACVAIGAALLFIAILTSLGKLAGVGISVADPTLAPLTAITTKPPATPPMTTTPPITTNPSDVPFDYSSSQPFLLCDGAQWHAVGMKELTDCSPAGPAIMAPNGTFGFNTVTSFPQQATLPDSYNASVEGFLQGAGPPYKRCLGVAAGGAQNAYIGTVCNDGTWHLQGVRNLGSDGASVAASDVANGGFGFMPQSIYTITLSLHLGKMTLAIDAGKGPIVVADRALTQPGTPVVGFCYFNSDTGPITLVPTQYYGYVKNFEFQS